MSPIRFRDDESSTGTTIATVLLGAVAGFAVGMYVAQRVGGFSGLTQRFKRTLQKDDSTARQFDFAGEVSDEIEEGADDADDAEDAEDAPIGAESVADDENLNPLNADDATDGDVPLLEERVLEAFNNDPILAERAIDIGSVGQGVIELAGWVDSDDEAEHAMTLARGVPGVETVVNRLLVDDEEHQLGENIRRFNEGDPALTDSHWEGQQIGTGKRRQGTSDELDRHADPKPKLEDQWQSEREAIRNAAEEIGDISAERRKKAVKGAKSTKAKGKADEAEPRA